jgi:predicted aldo/keto reductase-like oxidoreductase
MNYSVDRREFLKKTAAGAVSLTLSESLGLGPIEVFAAAKPGGIPQRVLGKTGVKVSQLAFGGGSRFLMHKTEEEGLQALNWAIDQGINYIDTAHSYGEGESERRVGLVMKQRRKEVFLVTKLGARTRDEYLKQFDLSLKRLQTDHVDLLHFHSLGQMDDVEKIGQKGGVYEAALKLKEQKATRFVGFTSHTDGAAAKAAIERFEFDCCMMQMNPSKAGGFEDLALPAALKKKMGVVAMKFSGQDKLLGEGPGKAKAEALLRYALSLPVAAVNAGMPKLEMLKQNVELARNFKPMSAQESKQLQQQLAVARATLEGFFARHSDLHHV